MRKAIALPLLAILLIGAACSSGPDQAEPPTTEEAGTVAVSSNRLLAPASFARYMEDNPDVPVVNVRFFYPAMNKISMLVCFFVSLKHRNSHIKDPGLNSHKLGSPFPRHDREKGL